MRDMIAIKEVEIDEGQSLSQVIDLWGFRLFSIEIPDGFEGSEITFLSSSDGEDLMDVYNDDGDEISLSVDDGRVVTIDANAGSIASLRYIQIRSGTTGAPQVQTSKRTLKLIMKG